MSAYIMGDAGEVEDAQDAIYFHISSPFFFFCLQNSISYLLIFCGMDQRIPHRYCRG
jgi:hypothetical protein